MPATRRDVAWPVSTRNKVRVRVKESATGTVLTSRTLAENIENECLSNEPLGLSNETLGLVIAHGLGFNLEFKLFERLCPNRRLNIT